MSGAIFLLTILLSGCSFDYSELRAHPDAAIPSGAGGSGGSALAGAAGSGGTGLIADAGASGSGGSVFIGPAGTTGTAGGTGTAGMTGGDADAGPGSGRAGAAAGSGGMGVAGIGGAGTAGAAGTGGSAGTGGTTGVAGGTGGQGGTAGTAGTGGAAGTGAINYCDRTHWTATASAGSPAAPVSQSIDGDLTTRWTSGRPQDATDFYQVNFGGTVKLTKITLDNSQDNSVNDFPPTYAIYASADGVTFDATPFATGSGTQSTVITFPEKTLRAVRIKDTGSTAVTWWAIGEFLVTCSL